MSEVDTYNLLESNNQIRHYLSDAIRKGEEKRLCVLVKGFPQCLLGEYQRYLDNSKPRTIIDERFWIQFKQNKPGQCRFKAICSAEKCKGLTAAYIKKFGTDHELYTPIR